MSQIKSHKLIICSVWQVDGTIISKTTYKSAKKRDQRHEKMRQPGDKTPLDILRETVGQIFSRTHVLQHAKNSEDPKHTHTQAGRLKTGSCCPKSSNRRNTQK